MGAASRSYLRAELRVERGNTSERLLAASPGWYGTALILALARLRWHRRGCRRTAAAWFGRQFHPFWRLGGRLRQDAERDASGQAASPSTASDYLTSKIAATRGLGSS
jgi:hypothetical protein